MSCERGWRGGGGWSRRRRVRRWRRGAIRGGSRGIGRRKRLGRKIMKKRGTPGEQREENQSQGAFKGRKRGRKEGKIYRNETESEKKDERN